MLKKDQKVKDYRKFGILHMTPKVLYSLLKKALANRECAKKV